MKKKKSIFHIGSEFRLIIKPKWLDAFRKKYDKPYPYHVTFKTSTFFDFADLEDLKKELREIAGKYSKTELKFNKLAIRPTSTGWCIMIMAQNNAYLKKLQKKLALKFAKFGHHIDKEHERHEVKFKPHITIARDLSNSRVKDAKKELGANLVCTAAINNLVLTTIKNDGIKEKLNPKNKYSLRLQNK